jgi:hypothetical protein
METAVEGYKQTGADSNTVQGTSLTIDGTESPDENIGRIPYV